MAAIISPKKRIGVTALTCLAAAGAAAALLFIVYALRGIWPFGTDSVAYIDTAQFFVPDYYALWDVMHGAKATGLTWYSGLSESGAAGWSSLLQNDILWPCFLNPANWVFFFIARDHILEALSLYLAVYTAMTAASACLALRVRFPGLGAGRPILLSLVYAFSGYVLQYYFSFGWFLIVILFPLLLLGLERLLREGGYVLYAVCYAVLLSLSMYFAYMVTVYILLFSFCYCVFLVPKELRGDRALRLGLSTAAAFGVSACLWTGNLATLTSASRFDSNLSSGLIGGFSTWNLPYTAPAMLMLLGSAFPIAVLLRSRRRLSGGRARQTARFFACVLGALLIPMVFTNIDTAWHFGQYNYFPMRYGFLLSGTLTAAAALCLDRKALPDPEDAPAPIGFRRYLPAAAAVAAAAALILLEPRLGSWFQEYSSSFLTTVGSKTYLLKYLPLYVGCGLLYILLYLCLFRLRSPRLRAGLTAAVLLMQLGANAWGLIGPDDQHSFAREYDPIFIEMSDELHAHFEDADLSPLSRAKNIDNSLNAGYPAVAGVSALSSVNSMNSSERLAAFEALGYTTNYFCILDTGGTVFTDMLLGVDRIFSLDTPDGDLYDDRGETAGAVHISEPRYPGVVGLMFPEGSLEGCLELPTLADRLNALHAAFGGSGTLAYVPDYAVTAGEGVLKSYTLEIDLTEDAFLYLAGNCSLMNIAVDGEPVPIPTYRNETNTVYPAAFNKNLISLGLRGAGTTAVTFQSAMDVTPELLSVTALSRDRLEAFRGEARLDGNFRADTGDGSLTAVITAPEEGLYLFLPMTYSQRWHCTVNGEPAEISPVLTTLMSVPLRQGENTVTLTYRAGSFRLSHAVSLISLLLAAAWLLLRRRPALAGKTLPAPAFRAAWVLLAAAFIAVMAFVYAVPTVLLIARGSIVTF